MKTKINRLFFGVLAFSSIALTPIASSPNFYEFETNFHGIKAIPFYDRSVTSEPQYSNSKAYQFNYMNVGSTWDTVRGDDVTVAVIDSGINIYHEDYLKPEAQGVTIDSSNVEEYSVLSPYSCYVHDTTNRGYYTSAVKTDVGILNALDDDTYDSTYKEYYSHGTCSAGCIGAAVNGVGTAGLSPNVTLLIIKIDFYFNSLDVAIRYAADHGADVINMSLGAYAESFTDGDGNSQSGSSSTATVLTSAINYAWNKGSVIVASAGNENQGGHKSYPACNEHVVGVGALEKKSGTSRASFSNWNVTDSSGNILENNNVDVTAPGYVWVPMVDDAANSSHYGMTQGTSFSSPLTAAACALYKSKYPSATNEDIVDRLFESCDDIGTTGFDKTFGYGRVNVANMLDDGDGAIKVNTVNVSPSSATLYVDGLGGSKTTTLTKSFLPTNAEEQYKSGLWISSDESVCTVDEDTGVVTAVGEGTTQVTFLTEYNKEGSATITVVDNNTYNVTGITLDKTSATMAIGGNLQLTPTIYPSNATNKNVTWTSSNTSIATVSATGYVSAKATGTTTITATTVDGSYTATCDITVNNVSDTIYGKVSSLDDLTIGSPVAIVAASYNYVLGSSGTSNRSAVSITKSTTNEISSIEKVSGMANLTLEQGSKSGTYAFYDNDAEAYLCAASSSSNQLKTEETLSDNSSFLITMGTSTTAVAQGSNSRNSLRYNNSSTIFSCYSTGQQPIAIYQPMVVGPTVDVETVTLDKTNAEVVIGSSLTLTATVSPSDATNKKLTWASSDTSVATVSDGVVTTKGVGTTTITATSNNGVSASCTVTVTPINVTGVSLNITSGELVVGKTTQLTATITPTNATTKSVTWSTSKDSVATISSSGLVTAVAPGTATITVRTTDGGFTATYDVTVIAKAVTKIQITSNATKTSYYVGDTFSTSGLVVKATWNDGTVQTVTSDCTISTPDMSTAGTKTITISYAGLETLYTITVTAVVLSSISVTTMPTKTTYQVGDTFDSSGLVVTATYNNGNKVVVTDYSLSTPDMSTVGTKTITVTYGGLTTTFDIKVSDPSAEQQYSITFKENSSDDSSALDASGALDEVESGSEYVSSFTSLSKVYAGKSGLKLGTSSAVGYFTMNLDTTTVTEKATAIIIHTAKYGSDSGTIGLYVNGNSVKTGISPAAGETVVELSSETKVTSIKVTTSAKRAYVSGFDIVYNSAGGADATAKTFANKFLSEITCTGAGAVSFTSVDWTAISIEYAGLSTQVQTIFKTAEAKVSGTEVEQCVARYDAIVSKYGSDTYEDFMERNPIASSKSLIPINDGEDLTMLVTILAIIGITGVGIIGFKTLKKKEQ